jgi:membrane protease YdiL (CAAX protease family)
MEQRSSRFVDRLPFGTGAKVWWILYPVLIYLAAQTAVAIVMVIGLTINIMPLITPEVLADPMAFQEQYIPLATEYVAEITLPLSWGLTLVCLAVYIPLFYRDMKKFKIRPDRLVKSNAFTWIGTALAALGFAFGFTFLSLFINLTELFPDMNRNAVLFTDNPIFTILLVGVLTPIMEEFFVRGLLFKRLRCVMGFLPSALISSLFFGILHMTPPQIIYATALGVLFAYLYEKKGSIWVPVFAHFVINTGITVFEYLAPESLYETLVSPLGFIIPFVISAGGVVLLITSVKKIPAYEAPVMELPVAEVPVTEIPQQ